MFLPWRVPDAPVAGNPLIGAAGAEIGLLQLAEINVLGGDVIASRQPRLVQDHRAPRAGERAAADADLNVAARGDGVNALVRVAGMNPRLLFLLIPVLNARLPAPEPIEADVPGHGPVVITPGQTLKAAPVHLHVVPLRGEQTSARRRLGGRDEQICADVPSREHVRRHRRTALPQQ